MIRGGFPKWSRTDKLKEWYTVLQKDMGDLAKEIKSMYPPGTQGHTPSIQKLLRARILFEELLFEELGEIVAIGCAK